MHVICGALGLVSIACQCVVGCGPRVLHEACLGVFALAIQTLQGIATESEVHQQQNLGPLTMSCHVCVLCVCVCLSLV
jgi:hypothetical protein